MASTPLRSLRRSARRGSGSSPTSASAAACAGPSTHGPTRSACRRSSPTPRSPTATWPSWRRRGSCAGSSTREDARQGVGKRSRAVLAEAYRDRYTREILDPVDLAPIAAALTADGPAALLCVERDPQACHRLIVAERLAARFDFQLTHLLPMR